MPDPKICFNTATLVAQHAGWRLNLEEWMDHDRRTVERTDDAAFEQMCRDIADAGFAGVELWRAHVDPMRVDGERGRRLRRMLAAHDLEPVALAGPLTDETARVCKLLDLPRAAAGLWGDDAAEAARVARATGLAFDFENHPEATTQAIRQAVPEGCGWAVDTGWLGTSGLDGPTAIRELKDLVRHVHVKDVREPGTHDNVPLGTGCVDLEGIFRELKAIGYDGWYSWEDEPSDRNPLDLAAEMRQWIAARI
jgi:sugar phosphate isomerase/epimerase